MLSIGIEGEELSSMEIAREVFIMVSVCFSEEEKLNHRVQVKAVNMLGMNIAFTIIVRICQLKY